MKKLLTLLLIISLVSCTKKNDDCFTCTWNPDQTGYVRPPFKYCGQGDDWISNVTFKDERGNDIGGRCDKR